MFIGKILGFGIGYKLGGPLGALLLAMAGHYLIDRHLPRLSLNRDPAAAQATFFRVTFEIMGAMAKADGRVSPEEIAAAEAAMTRMGLQGDKRREAIERFGRGKEADFDVELALGDLRRDCGLQPKLLRMFIEMQLQIAAADGQLAAGEEQLMRRIGSMLGVPAQEMERLLNMVRARRQFHGGGAGSNASPEQSLSAAYTVLGVSKNDSDADIKRAYRKLMSEHHPDKLAAKGLPPELMKVAEERAQEITTAYDAVKSARKAG